MRYSLTNGYFIDLFMVVCGWVCMVLFFCCVCFFFEKRSGFGVSACRWVEQVESDPNDSAIFLRRDLPMRFLEREVKEE
jgi:hypothetical protein